MRVAAIIAIAAGLSNCASIISQKNTYGHEGPGVKINDATVRMQVSPQGAGNGSVALTAMVVSTAIAKLEGPFRWRIEAQGTPGVHQSLVVHRIHTTTELSKRSEWYPAHLLNQKANFRVSKDHPEVARARYEIPGLLQVDSQKDGKLTILADISVSSGKGRERKLVKFRLAPQHKKANEMIFLPVEIVKSAGKDWEDMEDPSWD
jgi:hypothetical protein